MTEEKPAAYARFSPNGETLGLAFEPDDVTPAVRAQLEPLYRRPAPSPSARAEEPVVGAGEPMWNEPAEYNAWLAALPADNWEGVFAKVTRYEIAKLREEADQRLAAMHDAHKAEIAKLKAERDTWEETADKRDNLRLALALKLDDARAEIAKLKERERALSVERDEAWSDASQLRAKLFDTKVELTAAVSAVEYVLKSSLEDALHERDGARQERDAALVALEDCLTTKPAGQR